METSRDMLDALFYSHSHSNTELYVLTVHNKCGNAKFSKQLLN